jgi:hypothetical protein
MNVVEINSASSGNRLSAEAEAAIAAVISTRIVISYRELNLCFRIARGVGVGLHKIREWEREGMPHQHHPDDRYYHYCWSEVWEWYCLRGRARKQPNSPSVVTSQTWLRSE